MAVTNKKRGRLKRLRLPTLGLAAKAASPAGALSSDQCRSCATHDNIAMSRSPYHGPIMSPAAAGSPQSPNHVRVFLIAADCVLPRYGTARSLAACHAFLHGPLLSAFHSPLEHMRNGLVPCLHTRKAPLRATDTDTGSRQPARTPPFSLQCRR